MEVLASVKRIVTVVFVYARESNFPIRNKYAHVDNNSEPKLNTIQKVEFFYFHISFFVFYLFHGWSALLQLGLCSLCTR